MTSSWLEILWFRKRRHLRFWLWAERVQLGVGCGQCRNSQHSKNCVSLSSCRKTKLKKLINVSYLNYRESSVFRDFSASEYFTYSYILAMLHVEQDIEIKEKLNIFISLEKIYVLIRNLGVGLFRLIGSIAYQPLKVI